jgi:hypothetical protein
MPKQIVRIGDQFVGTCFNHDNPISITGNIIDSLQDFTNDVGVLVAVDGSPGVASCGHVGNLIASSSLWFINGIRVGLIGDRVIGNGIQANMIEGSPLTNSD